MINNRKKWHCQWQALATNAQFGGTSFCSRGRLVRVVNIAKSNSMSIDDAKAKKTIIVEVADITQTTEFKDISVAQ